MSEAKHTPGPWIADGGYISSATAIKSNGAPVHVADPYVDESLLASSEVDANARLIAAAPQLLAACKMMDKWIERDLSDDPELEELTLQTVYGSVLEAIAKAEGSSK